VFRTALPILALLTLVVTILALDRPAPRADFTFINRGDVSTLDPAIISWQQDNRVARLISEGLTRSDPFTHNFAVEPAVAERWDVCPDGRDYTFYIRAGARWSNGNAVHASDFVYSWRRSMLPDLAGDYVKLYEVIEGAKEFIEWRTEALARFASDATLTDQTRPAAAQALWRETLAQFESLVQVRALDDRTLRVRLVRPTAYFLDLTGFPPLYPVFPPLVEAYQSIDPATAMVRSRSDWTKPPLSVTNGPFVLQAWRFKRDMRFAQSPHYWNQASLAIRSIAIPSVQDPNTSVLAFTTGAVDWVSDVIPGYRDEMLAQKRAFYGEHQAAYDALAAQSLDPIEIDRRLPPDPRNRISVFPAFGTYFYNFMCLPTLRDGRTNPLADARVRRALALCVNKEAIARDVRRVGEPAVSVLVPRGSIAGYESPAGLPYDPERGRALLAQAGYAGGAGLMPIEILFNKDAGHDLIAQAIAKEWERELGVSVRLEQVEVKVFRERLKNGDFMVSRAAWFGDYGDPTTFLHLNRCGDGNNDRKYCNPAYDALLAEAENAATKEQRLAMLSEAERVIVEQDLPLIPIFQYVQLYLFDPHKLTGISSHPRGEQQLFRVDVFGDGQGTDEPKVMKKGEAGAGTLDVGGK
jgi:oligopeptide transport system substrate-binding protein